MILTTITDIGDSLVLGGIVLAGALYLFFSRCPKGALALLFSLLGSALLISLAKLAFIGCGGHAKDYNLYSPSGHTALCVAVFGTYGFIMASQLKGIWRFLPALVFAPLVFAIAVSRVALNYHSIPEVTVGFTIGGFVLICTAIFLKRGAPLPKFNLHALILYVIVTTALLHGFHSPAEHWIEVLASYVPKYAPVCK